MTGNGRNCWASQVAELYCVWLGWFGVLGLYSNSFHVANLGYHAYFRLGETWVITVIKT